MHFAGCVARCVFFSIVGFGETILSFLGFTTKQFLGFLGFMKLILGFPIPEFHRQIFKVFEFHEIIFNFLGFYK